jgi:heme-degrading monooxygenase HmoA
LILEIATFDIKPDSTAAFEAGFEQARHVISRARGYLSHEMHRSVDVPTRYVLFVKWRTRDDHMIGFRESDLFPQWRAALQAHFATPPVVDHVELLNGNA